MNIVKVSFPKQSILSGHIYDYADSYCGNLDPEKNDITPTDIAKGFFSSSPKWVHFLMSLRNSIVSIFGLKTGASQLNDESSLDHMTLEKGDQLGIFKVFDKNDQELILGENDKHLNFRVSLMIDPEPRPKKKLIISTIVIFHNWFGKLYFLPVKPFHKFIVRRMLKRTIQSL